MTRPWRRVEQMPDACRLGQSLLSSFQERMVPHRQRTAVKAQREARYQVVRSLEVFRAGPVRTEPGRG